MMKQKPTAHYPSNTIFKQHFIIVGYELGAGLSEGNLHETVDVVCDYLQPDNTVDPVIANPLLLYCVDDDYFLDEKRYAAQIKAAKLYYGILL